MLVDIYRSEGMLLSIQSRFCSINNMFSINSGMEGVLIIHNECLSGFSLELVGVVRLNRKIFRTVKLKL
jgi:hypothetical protein